MGGALTRKLGRGGAAVAMAAAALLLPAPARADVEISVNTTEDTLSGSCIGGGGTCSLRKALSLVNEDEVGGDVRIEIVAEGALEMELGEMVVEPPAGVESLLIEGPGATALTIDGQDASRIFKVNGGEVTIAGVTLAEGHASGVTVDTDGGGALYQEAGTVRLEGVVLSGNRIGSGRQGGAIDLRGGDLTIVDSAIEDNETDGGLATGYGGAIYMDAAAEDLLTIERSSVTGNEAEGHGGAIYQDEGSLLVSDGSLIGSNHATESGGGIFADADGSASTTIEGESRVVVNTASVNGGGLISSNGSGGLTVKRSLIAENHAGESGGGLRLEGMTTIEASTISDNESASGIVNGGGGIDAAEGELHVVTSTIAENKGGGIDVKYASVEIEGSTIADNEASDREAGGITGGAGGDVDVTSSLLAGNRGEEEEAADCEGENLSSGGHNIVESVPPVCDWTQQTGDQLNLDAEVGPLADNGGPWRTVAPTTRTSPAVNHGASPAAADVRGLTRPVPAGIVNSDVGAVEVQAPLNLSGEPPSISPASGLSVGETLTCDPGGWDVDTIADPTYAYGWEVGGEPVGSASTYELAAADAGEEVTCTVTVDNGATATAVESAPVELAAAEAVLSPTSLDFGERNVDSGASAPQALTLSNEGAVALTIEDVTSSDSTQFPLDASACPASLAPGAECTVTASFDPSDVGARSATVTVESDGGEPTAQLSGTGTQPLLVIDPVAHDFGSHRAGAGFGSAQIFTVENVGDGAAVVGQATIAGTDAADFSIPGDNDGCSEDLLPVGEECLIEVVFSPGADGERNATLSFPGEAPVEAELSGTGVTPVFAAAPAAIEFGSVVVGAGPAASQAVTVTNEGTGSLRIEQVSVLGEDAEAFAIVAGADGCSNRSLEASESCSVAVEFEPTVVGKAEAELFFPGDGAVGVSLAGTGSATDPSDPSDSTVPTDPGRPTAPPPASSPSQAAPGVELLRSRRVRATPAGRVPLRVRCTSPAGTPCATTLWLRPVGAGGAAAPLTWRGTIAAGVTRRVTVRLGRATRVLLGKRGSLRFQVTAGVNGGTRSELSMRVLSPPEPAASADSHLR